MVCICLVSSVASQLSSYINTSHLHISTQAQHPSPLTHQGLNVFLISLESVQGFYKLQAAASSTVLESWGSVNQIFGIVIAILLRDSTVYT